MEIYRTIQFKIPILTQYKLRRVEEAQLRYARAVDELIRRAREHFDSLSFTYPAKDKHGNPVLDKKTGEPVLRARGAQFLAGDLRGLMSASEIPLASDIKAEVYLRVAMALISAWRLKEMQKKGKLNLSGGSVGLPRPKEYEGREEKYLEALRLMCDLPFIYDDSFLYEVLMEYLTLYNALVAAIGEKMEDILTDLPWGPLMKKEKPAARDRLRQKEIEMRLNEVLDFGMFVNVPPRLKTTARRGLAWKIVRFLQRCEATGNLTYEGEGTGRTLCFQDEDRWQAFIVPLKVDLPEVDTTFVQLMEEEINALRYEGFSLNEKFVSHMHILSGKALLEIENVLRAEVSRLLDPKLLPLRSTKFRLYIHDGLNPNRVQSRKHRKETRPNKERMIVGKMNRSLFIYFPMFPRGDEMCSPRPRDEKNDHLSPLFGASKVPRNGQGLLLPLRGGAFQEAWVKEHEAELRKVKRLRDTKTGEVKPRFRKLLRAKIEPKVAELIKGGNEYFINLSFSLVAEQEIIPKTVMSVSLGLNSNKATCTVLDLQTGNHLDEFIHEGIPYIEYVLSQDPRVAKLQKQGVDLRDRGYGKLLDEHTYRVVNSIIERAVSLAAVIVVEDLKPGPTKTGRNSLLNRKRSLWNYGKFSQFLLDKAEARGLPLRKTIIGANQRANLFSVLSVIARMTCSQCGETNIGKKKDEERFIETQDEKMHCKKCGIILEQAVNTARVIASLGRNRFLEYQGKEAERRNKNKEEHSELESSS